MDERVSTDWTVAAGRFGEYPAEMRLRRGAFEHELGKPEYSTAVVVQVMLNDPNDDGLPTLAENNELANMEDALGSIVVYPGDVPSPPGVTTVSIGRGQTRANNAILKLAPDGSIWIWNTTAGTVDVILDVNGVFQ